jgi:hypothetical protein
LHVVVEQPHLLTGLESWHANVRTSVTPERIAQAAVSAGTNLALDREVHFCKVIRVELQCCELFVG